MINQLFRSSQLSIIISTNRWHWADCNLAPPQHWYSTNEQQLCAQLPVCACYHTISLLVCLYVCCQCNRSVQDICCRTPHWLICNAHDLSHSLFLQLHLYCSMTVRRPSILTMILNSHVSLRTFFWPQDLFSLLGGEENIGQWPWQLQQSHRSKSNK